jgi:DNA/RNA-binding domain of Phe-tRNA-synthetase-like protein
MMKFFPVLAPTLNTTPLSIGAVLATDLKVTSSSQEFQSEVAILCSEIFNAKESDKDAKTKQSIRALLKFGKFRATGRSKPASEYLYNLVKDTSCINFINNIVDINNYISLKYLLPVSVFDLDKCTPPLMIRHGQASERYIFNQGGQDIELQDLLIVSDHGGDRPIGNPVKDSMATKVFEESVNVLGVIYANKNCTSASELERATHEFAALLKLYAGAKEIQSELHF